MAHTEDLCYLFYPYMMKDLGLTLPGPDSEEYKIINRLVQMWTDFAKTGYITSLISFSESFEKILIIHFSNLN